MGRSRRSDGQRREASKDLLYEVGMLRATAAGVASGLLGQGPLHDAVLESFIVHARCLLHFLFPENAYETDVLAEDYFDESSAWNDLRGELPASLSILRSRANKRVAHLTYDRSDATTRGWDVPNILAGLDGKLDVFFSSVRRDLVDSHAES